MPSTFEPGDQALFVENFEPTQAGSTLFKLTGKVLPVFIEDIRLKIGASDITPIVICNWRGRVFFETP